MNKLPCKTVEGMVKVIATPNIPLILQQQMREIIRKKRKEGWKLPDI
jgi:hypothetical protein